MYDISLLLCHLRSDQSPAWLILNEININFHEKYTILLCAGCGDNSLMVEEKTCSTFQPQSLRTASGTSFIENTFQNSVIANAI
jgi:hypothetical protein